MEFQKYVDIHIVVVVVTLRRGEIAGREVCEVVHYSVDRSRVGTATAEASVFVVQCANIITCFSYNLQLLPLA